MLRIYLDNRFTFFPLRCETGIKAKLMPLPGDRFFSKLAAQLSRCDYRSCHTEQTTAGKKDVLVLPENFK